MDKIKESKLYWSENALVSYDNSINLASIFYSCGALYIGEVDKNLKREGLGLFFLPFCGFLFGKFHEDKADNTCLLKEPDGTTGIYNFKRGVQDGQAIKYFEKTGEGRIETYSAGLFRALLFGEKREPIRDYCDEFQKIFFLADELKSKIENSSLFRISKTETSFAIGAHEEGKLNGIAIRFNYNFTIEKGFFREGNLRGCCQRLLPSLVCVFSFVAEQHKEQTDLLFSISTKKWNYLKADMIMAESVDTTFLFKLLSHQFVQTGLNTPFNSKRIPFNADPDAILFNKSILKQKKAQHLNWEFFFSSENLKEGFEGWLQAFFNPLNNLVNSNGTISVLSSHRSGPLTAQRSCETKRLSKQRGSSTSRAMLCSTARIFQEDIVSLKESKGLRRCSSRYIQGYPQRDLFASVNKVSSWINPNRASKGDAEPKLAVTARNLTGDSKRALKVQNLLLKAPEIKNCRSQTNLRPSVLLEGISSGKEGSTENATISNALTKLSNSLRRGLSQTSLETPSEKKEISIQIMSPTAFSKKTPSEDNKKIQSSEQTIEESIDMSYSEKPRETPPNQFLSFYKYKPLPKKPLRQIPNEDFKTMFCRNFKK